MDVSTIIISYNTSDLIGNCLDSVIESDDIIKEVFVIDNASSDESAVYIWG